jgi:hypothetical protein
LEHKKGKKKNPIYQQKKTKNTVQKYKIKLNFSLNPDLFFQAK